MEDTVSNFTRSTLYNIEPIGLGTGSVESLSSYLMRVSYEHNVTVGTLLNKMIFPQINKKYLSRSANYGGNRFFEGSRTINGYMENAIVLKRAMEILTCRNNLSDLTLLKLKELIPQRNLLKETFYWCPECIRDRENEEIYYPLIWYVKPVILCNKHNRYLLNKCFVCSKKIDVLRRQMIPGYCPHCFNSLSICKESKQPTLEELEWQLYVKQNIEDLLSTKYDQEFSKNFKVLFIKKINLINDQYFSGNISAFSKEFAIPKTTLLYWLHGHNFPSLDYILKICFKLNKNILNLLLESSEDAVNIFLINNKQIINKNKKYTREPLNHELIENKLMEHLTTEIPMSMNSIAKLIGRDRRVLYRNFPDLCKQISKKYKDYTKEKSEQRIKSLMEQIQQAFNELIKEGVYPSRRKIEKRINKNGLLKEKVLQDYWKDLLKQSGYEGKDRRI